MNLPPPPGGYPPAGPPGYGGGPDGPPPGYGPPGHGGGPYGPPPGYGPPGYGPPGYRPPAGYGVPSPYPPGYGTPGGFGRYRRPPPSNLGIAITSLVVGVVCGGCLGAIPGVVAVVNAAKVESTFHAGDHSGALGYSDQAHSWAVIGFWVTGILFVLGVILQVWLQSQVPDTYGN